MLCDKCKQREANIHIKQSINGVTTERNLCEVCAKEEHGLMDAFSMDGFFNDLFTTSLMKRGSGRIGNMFEFMPQEPTGGIDRHHAEFMGLEGPYESSVELPEIKLGVNAGNAAPAGNDLKAQLDQAIKEENYERAAEIRDLMKKKEEK